MNPIPIPIPLTQSKKSNLKGTEKFNHMNQILTKKIQFLQFRANL